MLQPLFQRENMLHLEKNCSAFSLLRQSGFWTEYQSLTLCHIITKLRLPWFIFATWFTLVLFSSSESYQHFHISVRFFTVAQLWHEENFLKFDSCSQWVPQLSTEPGTSPRPSAPRDSIQNPRSLTSNAPQTAPCSSRRPVLWLEGDSPQENGQCRTTMTYLTLHPTRC